MLVEATVCQSWHVCYLLRHSVVLLLRSKCICYISFNTVLYHIVLYCLLFFFCVVLCLLPKCNIVLLDASLRALAINFI